MSAEVLAVVPVRSLRGGKTRLAGVLPPPARAELTRQMLRRVVDAALGSDVVARVLVISPDPEALEYAATLHPAVVPVQQDPDAPGLNHAIAQGLHLAREEGAAAVLTLFSDLPLLTADDVRNLVRRDAPVVIAPDRHGTGTNALMLRLAALPPDSPPFTFHFGPESYARHLEEADAHGLEVSVSFAAGTAVDLDTPDDLDRLLTAKALTIEGADGIAVAAGATADLTADGAGE